MNLINMKEYCKLSFCPAPHNVGKVFDTDDRTQVGDISKAPYNAIVRLLIEDKGTSYQGTGFMVKPGVMVTAGHNVYNFTAKKFYDKISALDNATQTWHQAFNIAIDPLFPKDNSAPHDWAVVAVAVDPGKTVPCLSILRMDQSDSPDVTKTTEEIAGFPLYVRDVETENMYTETGTILFHDKDATTFQYRIDTSGGNSGSPIILYKDSVPYAIGIHVESDTSYNRGKAIDQAIVNAIMKM